MENKEYLSEEKYQINKNKISKFSLIILIMGIVVGLLLISIGFINMNKTNNKYSEETKQKEITRITNEIEKEKNNLQIEKQSLEQKGITYNNTTKYDDGESYDLKIITNALDPSFEYCSFSEYKNNNITKKYCSLKLELIEIEQKDMDFERRFNSHSSIPFFMIGAFIIIATLMISGSIYSFTKRREILSFTAQQVMPIAEEGLEKIAPTIGKVGKDLSKEMAPIYGEIAKEITKGIKKGSKEK